MRRLLKWIGVIAIIVAIVLVFRSCGSDESVAPEATPPSSPAVACEYPLTFQTEGELPELQLLPDKSGSTHAVETHTDVVKGLKENPRFLAAFANRLAPSLWANGSDWKPLATEDNKCLSSKGVEVLGKIMTIFEFQLDNVNENALADRNLVNMGMTAEGLVSNAVPGIDGDRSAIVYRFKDGTEVTVLKRCANLPRRTPVYPTVPPSRFNPAPVPAPKPVPTTVPPTTTVPTTTTTTTTVPPTTTTTVPPPPPVTVVPKVPEEDPYPQGNAPQGGGPNEDPGPGQYVPPEEMERPPETSRTNPPPPPPPAPAPAVPDEPVSTPTPTTLVTTPPVEPGAGSGETSTPDSGNGANGANDGDPGGF